MAHYLDALFNPKSVAIIGVSATSDPGGNRILAGLRGGNFAGRIYAVGRRGGEIDGMPITKSLADLPEVPDLVFSAVGLGATPTGMVEAARLGVKVGIVYTAGFAEMSAEGASAEREMVEACNELGMRVVGPNCMGVFNRSSGLNLTSLEDVSRGSIGLISQSGNIALTLFETAPLHDLGFGAFVSFGNQSDIPAADYIEYMAADPAIDVIVMYLESLQDGAGEDFVRRSAMASRTKPIIAIKGGVTDAGRRAAASHTSRLSGTVDVYAAAFAQAGIVQVSELDDVLAVAEALMRCPTLASDEVAIVGSGGGHSTIGTDCVESVGLRVPAFADDLVAEISAHLPPWAPVRNPVDMTGGFTEDLTLFARLMTYPLAKPEYAGGLSYGLYGDGWKADLVDENGLTFTTAAPLLGRLQAELGKPIVFYTPYATVNSPAFTAMRQAGVPCYGSLRQAAAALAALRSRAKFLAKSPATPEASTNDSTGIRLGADLTTLTEAESLKLLAGYGVPTVRQESADSAEAVVKAASEIGYPVVLKARLENVPHKSDVGGVMVGISSETELIAAVGKMRERVEGAIGKPFDGFTVSEQVRGERELIIGIRKDAVFGHTYLLGIGGTLTEIVATRVVLVPPMSQEDLALSLQKTALATFLHDWRGHPAIDVGRIFQLLQAMSTVSEDDKLIDSVDVNPLISIGDLLVAVDASVTLRTAV